MDRQIKLEVTGENNLIEKIKDYPYEDTEWIYEQSEDKLNRFLLGTKGNRTLICCGVNPSTASPKALDPTMKRVDAFAKANGYDSYIMINLYPMRATNPNNMHKNKDCNIVKKNLEYILSVLESGKVDIWAAWGNLIEKRRYLKECLAQIVAISNTYHCTWYTMGEKTKSGHPRHPLYISNKATMEKLDINEYLECLK